jgi:hypothetical protein
VAKNKFVANHWKTVPQGLKPSLIAYFTARLNACPSYSEFFRSLFRPDENVHQIRVLSQR